MQSALKSNLEFAKEETYYELLKVDRSATITEIVAAYHAAKNAFSKDSVATYSLFSPEDTKLILEKLEEAYLTLSNIEKKREYDRRLSQGEPERAAQGAAPNHPPGPGSVTELTSARSDNNEVRTAPMNPDLSQQPAQPVTDSSPAPTREEATDPNLQIDASMRLNGALLTQIREHRGLSLDDVSRITKIPGKFIRALEAEDVKHLPARVYVQGFLKNLASLYRLDPKVAVTAYLESLDKASEHTTDH